MNNKINLPLEKLDVEENIFATVHHVEFLCGEHDLSNGRRIRTHHDDWKMIIKTT